jgi:cytochrome c6
VNRCGRLWFLGLLIATLAFPALAQNNGEQIYKARCTMCHGQDGLATTPVAKMMNVPSFRSPAAMHHTSAQMIDITNNGKGRMPSFKGTLTAAQVEQVVAYIRHLQRQAGTP